MGQFIYSPVNPVRLTQQIIPDAKYNTVPFDRRQSYDCYSQKFQYSDTAIFEMLSDWPVTLKVYDENGILQTAPAPVVTLINNEKYSLYKFTINWSAYSGDAYYVEATYTDDSTIQQVWRSELLQLSANWPNTILFEYRNTYNKLSAIFSDGTIFQFRVEGIVYEFNPEFDDSTYNDQYHETSLLYSIPYRTFTLDIGGAPLVPEWVIDRVNYILACDRVQIDGAYYRNTEGSKWEIERTEPDGTGFIHATIAVIEVNDVYLQELTPGETPTGGFRIVSRIVEAKSIGGNYVISASPQFNENSLVKYISFTNRGTAFTARVGTSPLADDVMKDATIASGYDTVEVGIRLSATTPLYLTAPAGSDLDMVVGYDQFDAPLITPGSIITQIKGRPRSVSMYDYTTQEQLEQDFDLATGLGINDFAGTTIMGTNGATDWSGKVPMAYKKGLKWSQIGITVAGDPEIPLGVTMQNAVGIGEYRHTLVPAELPPMEVLLPGATNANPNNGKLPFSGYSAPGQGLVPLEVFGGDASQPNGGPTTKLLGQSHNNLQPSIYCIYYKELP